MLFLFIEGMGKLNGLLIPETAEFFQWVPLSCANILVVLKVWALQ